MPPPPVVGHRDHDRGGEPREGAHDAFDTVEGDVDAARDDHVVDASLDREASVLQAPRVTRAVPPLPLDDRERGGLAGGIPEISGCEDRTGEQHLPGLDPHAYAGEGRAVVHAAPARLARPVGADEPHPEVLRPLAHGRGQRLTADEDALEPAQARRDLGILRRVEEPHELCRHERGVARTGELRRGAREGAGVEAARRVDGPRPRAQASHEHLETRDVARLEREHPAALADPLRRGRGAREKGGGAQHHRLGVARRPGGRDQHRGAVRDLDGGVRAERECRSHPLQRRPQPRQERIDREGGNGKGEHGRTGQKCQG